MDAAKAIGRRIRAIREHRGMSQKDLAAKVKTDKGDMVAAQFISNLENGHSNPSVETLQRVAAGLKVDLVAIMSFDSDGPWPSRQTLMQVIEAATDSELHRLVRILAMLRR